MQFKVPQNISMEDRILGPLTMVQFILGFLGMGIAFLFLTIKSIAPVNTVLAGIMALTTAVLVLGKFNDQPLYKFIRFIIVFVTTPRTRVWHKGGAQIELVKPSAPKEDPTLRRSAKNVSKADIARLATIIDSRGTIGGTPPNPLAKSK